MLYKLSYKKKKKKIQELILQNRIFKDVNRNQLLEYDVFVN